VISKIAKQFAEKSWNKNNMREVSIA
jgi:hypothetical protein